MNCPQCAAKVADGTSICPSCDYILDASFLSAEPPEPNDDDEVDSAPPPRPAPRPSAGRAPARKPPPRRRPAAAATAAAAPSPRIDTPPSADRVPEEAYPAQLRAPGNVVAPEAMLDDARDFVRDLSSSDKLAFIGAAVTVLLCFMPWKETAREGEVLGLMSLGVVTLLANVAGMGAIFVRVKNAVPRLGPVATWLLQLGAFAFGLLWCLVYLKLSSDGRLVQAAIGNEQVAVSSPAFGVFLAMLTELVAIAGTVMGLRDRSA